MSSYYFQNREVRLAYEHTVVTCPCGHEVKRQGLSSHKKWSPRHRVWVDTVKSLEYKKLIVPFEMSFK